MSTTKIGRPLLEPPADAAERLEALAADGWSLRGIAKALGASHVTLNRWLEDDPALQEAVDAGRENERWTLHNVLYKQATEKNNIVAAMFLLKARHGYREGAEDAGNKVNIVFTLPGALPMDEFLKLEKVVKSEPAK